MSAAGGGQLQVLVHWHPETRFDDSRLQRLQHLSVRCPAQKHRALRSAPSHPETAGKGLVRQKASVPVPPIFDNNCTSGGHEATRVNGQAGPTPVLLRPGAGGPRVLEGTKREATCRWAVLDFLGPSSCSLWVEVPPAVTRMLCAAHEPLERTRLFVDSGPAWSGLPCSPARTSEHRCISLCLDWPVSPLRGQAPQVPSLRGPMLRRAAPSASKTVAVC